MTAEQLEQQAADKGLNPYWLAYAAVNGKSVDDKGAINKARFLAWIREQHDALSLPVGMPFREQTRAMLVHLAGLMSNDTALAGASGDDPPVVGISGRVEKDRGLERP